MYRCAGPSIFCPTYPEPISPESPTPRMVSARPEATWLAASPSVSAAKTAESAIPARMPHRPPTASEPVTEAPANPHAAPTIIMPSTPRFKTPARSTTSSPDAASNNGVEAVMMVSRMASANSMSDLRGRHQTETVEDQRVAGEHVEQQDALEHLGEVERHLHHDLRALSANEGQREEKRRDKDADRVQPPEEGDDDPSEAVAGRDVRLQVIDRRRDLDDAGKPRERA